MPDRFNKPIGHKTKGSKSQESKDPKLLARNNEATAGAPVTDEPTEVQNPLITKPVQVRDTTEATGAPPYSSGKR